MRAVQLTPPVALTGGRGRGRRGRWRAVAPVLLVVLACTRSGDVPRPVGAGTATPPPARRDATMLRVDFSTGTRTENGFGVDLRPGHDLVGTATIESESGNGEPRSFWLLALFDGLQAPVLAPDRRDLVTVRGPRATVAVRITAGRLPRGAHRLTVLVVDSQADDAAAQRPPFEARALTYDVVVGRQGAPRLAAHGPDRLWLVPDGGPLPPFVADEARSNYLKTRHVADRELFVKVGTPSRAVTHYLALLVDGHQRAWDPARPGLLRVPAKPNDLVVHPLPLDGLDPGEHRVTVVTIPDLERTFFDRPEPEVGSRTFVVTTT